VRFRQAPGGIFPGNQYINDFVPPERVGKGLQAPLQMVMCGNCSLLQLRHTAPQELLYSRFYWYRSGVTETMRSRCGTSPQRWRTWWTCARATWSWTSRQRRTMLATYTAPGIHRVGCEPADNLVEDLRKNADFVMHDFWDCDRYMDLARGWGIGKAKVITAIGMSMTWRTRTGFIRDACRALADDGIFVPS